MATAMLARATSHLILLFLFPAPSAANYMYYGFDEEPPSQPPPPPNPRPPPFPPVVPGRQHRVKPMLCNNQCEYARDGMCDDGGDAEDAYENCALGTDCADCGPRGGEQLCVSCPVQCNALGASKRPNEWCTEAMWANNGMCDPTCNNWECQHDGGECAAADILDVCLPLQVKAAKTLARSPTTNGTGAGGNSPAVPVELIITKLEPLIVTLDGGTNSWSLEVRCPRLSIRDSPRRSRLLPTVDPNRASALSAHRLACVRR